MQPGKIPPVVSFGPWRSAGPPPVVPREEPGWLSGLGDLFSSVFDCFDLVEILCGVGRVVLHVVMVVIHGIFHF